MRCLLGLSVILVCCAGSVAGWKHESGALQAKPAPASKASQPKFKAIFEPVNYPQDVKLADIYFTDEQHGWAAGGTSESHGGVILYTADGGEHWKVQQGDPASSDSWFRDLRFTDSTHGWATQGTSSTTYVWHTSDGTNWTQAGQIAEHYADYAFTSENDGIYMDAHQIFQTHDGGQTWKPVAACQVTAQVNGLARQLECEFKALHFPTATVGYAVGGSGDAPKDFFVFKTQDGGATWAAQTIAAVGDARDVYFTTARTGLVRVGYADTGRLYLTDDGGEKWVGIASSPGDRMRFADSQVGWAFHYGKMSYTTDGGRHWNSREFQFPASVLATCLASPRSGYVAGAHGMVYRYRIVPIGFHAEGMLDAPVLAVR
jgi:photosystem II stability/assembly factor-like uncharacterized protein